MQAVINNETTFLWYDYETFGADPIKDRPVQFGALRTNTKFEPLGQPVNLYAQVADDYLPAASACLVTGVTPMRVMEQEDALLEFDFAYKIYKASARPNTISIGFNSIRFDEVVTRFLLWRNLLPPYERESKKGRGKFDVFLFIKALYAFYPDTLKWPEKEDGSVSMRLEHLTKANGICHGHAHEASSDAIATKDLAKLIAQRQPKIWEYALNLSLPDNAEEVITGGERHQVEPLLYVDYYATKDQRGLKAILPLMESPISRKEWICWDLSADPDEVRRITAEDVKERLFLTREQREQGIEPLPFVVVNLKKQPFFTRGLGWIDGRGKGTFEHPAAFYRARAERILNDEENPEFLHGLFAEQAEQARENLRKNDYVLPEESLYFSNYSFADKDKLMAFREVPVSEMLEKLSRMDFESGELEKLAFHYMARNWPEETLDPESEAEWRKFKADKLIKGLGASRTFEEFFAEIDELSEKYADDEEKTEILEELREYGQFLLDDFQG